MRILKYVTAIVVAVAGALVLPTAAHAAPVWSSGVVAPGVTQSWVWNNVPLGTLYEVGLSPSGATPAAPCSFEILTTGYVQQPSGEREFHFSTKNNGTISCSTIIILRELTTSTTAWQMSSLSSGATTTLIWNNAATNMAYAVGLVPVGAVGTTPCRLEITRRWDLLHVNSNQSVEREFRFSVKNVGAIPCSALVLLKGATDNNPIIGGLVNLGETQLFRWNNAAPTSKSFIFGVQPNPTSTSLDCVFEITRRWYLQQFVVNGTYYREAWGAIKNVGGLNAVACFPNILIA